MPFNKTYKNKLIGIKRFCEKAYYSKLLEDNKNNIKETWKILNDIMNKKSKKTTNPQNFIDSEGNTITDEKTAANQFNEFFINVGPNLAAKIKKKKIVVTYLIICHQQMNLACF